MMNIPKIFQSEDIIFHYCSLKTAIDYILFDERLRLSPRKNSIDPIESTEPFFHFSSPNNDLNYQEGQEILKLSKSKIKKAKQLCFCKNAPKKVKENSNPKYPLEYYGFLKPRMWDQYADKYNGVCLAFSLEEIQNEISRQNLDLTKNDIEYVEFNQLKNNDYSINIVEARKFGVEGYWDYYAKKIEKVMFRKHVDYSGENEYRLMSFSENEYDYIPIQNCLKGIIISKGYGSNILHPLNRNPIKHILSATKDAVYNSLNKFVEQYEIELLYIKWEETGVSVTTKKEHDSLQEKIVASFYPNVP